MSIVVYSSRVDIGGVCDVCYVGFSLSSHFTRVNDWMAHRWLAATEQSESHSTWPSFSSDAGGLHVFSILFHAPKAVKEMPLYAHAKKENLTVEIHLNVIVGGIRVHDESISCFSRINRQNWKISTKPP